MGKILEDFNELTNHGLFLKGINVQSKILKVKNDKTNKNSQVKYERNFTNNSPSN